MNRRNRNIPNKVSALEIKDASGAVSVSADYSQLGGLLITVTLLGFTLPMLAILIAKRGLLAKQPQN